MEVVAILVVIMFFLALFYNVYEVLKYF